MAFRLLPLLALATAAVLPASAAAPGAWTTFLRTRDFTDLIAQPDRVWCATGEAGLLRLDRASGRVDAIRREPGLLASNRLASLAYDRSGRLWVGTLGSGVSRLSADETRWDLINVLDGLPADTVKVLEAQGDTIWIGTTRGIALWNGREIAGSLPDGNTVSFDTTFSSPSITGIAVLEDTLWLATRRGVGFARLSTSLTDWRPRRQGIAVLDIEALASDGRSLFALAAGTAYRFRPELDRWEPESGAGLVHNLVDDLGVVLAGGESGVFRWDGAAWIAVPGSPAVAASAGEDPEPTVDAGGTVFAATSDGIYEQPGTPGTWNLHEPPPGPPGNNLLHVGLEGSRVYVTTFNQGVGRYDGEQWRYWLPGVCSGSDCDTTFQNPVFALGLLIDPQGRKWVGCWSAAFDSFDDRTSPPRFTHHVVPSNLPTEKRTWVVSSAVDSSGGRWFGMDTPLKGDVDPIGLEYYDSSAAYVRNFDLISSNMAGNLVHGLTVSRNGRIWVGYDGKGLDFITLPADSSGFVHIASSTNLAIRGLAAHGDDLWALTNAELIRYSASAGPNSQPLGGPIPVPGGQAQLGVNPLAVSSDGTVWAATAAGLRVFQPGGATESFTTLNSPLTDDEVRAVVVDRNTGVVWITTADGLNRYDPAYVPLPPPPIPTLRIRVFPNPAVLTGLGIQLRLSGDASSYRGEIYDLTGRRVARFAVGANGQVVWNGRSEDGTHVKPGVYLVRAEAGGRVAVARVALLR